MALSNTWETSNEIYKPVSKTAEVKEKVTIYRTTVYGGGVFEAFVVGETETAWLIDDNNGVKCAVKKATTKNNILKVNFNYVLIRPKRN